MKMIKLTKGKVTIVDDDDYEWLNQRKWYCGSSGYARRHLSVPGWPIVYMHREILGISSGVLTDHINGDKLDNRKANLRTCNASQNNGNRKKYANNTSGHKGVVWHKDRQKWVAQIGRKGRPNYIGIFTNIEDAVHAYKEAAIEYFGEFAKI